MASVPGSCFEKGIEARRSLDVPELDCGGTARRDGHGRDVDDKDLSQDESEKDRHDGGWCLVLW